MCLIPGINCAVPVESYLNFIGFTKYGLLQVRKRSQLVSINSELESKDKSFLIDPETVHVKEISYIGNQVDNPLDIAAYMENLTLLDGEIWYLTEKDGAMCITGDVITGMYELKLLSCIYWLHEAC